MTEQIDTGGCMVLAVASGKGGVGKSVCSILLAEEFARRGQRVLLVDGAAGEGTLHVLLGARPVRDERAGIDGRFETRLEGRLEARIKGRHEAPRPVEVASGLWFLSAESEAGLSASDPRERARAHLRRTDGFADFDFAVVDAGPGIEAALRATIRCSRLLAVAVPEPASLYSAYALIKTVVSQVPHLPIDLLVNRVTATEEGDRAFEILDSASRSFLDRSLTCRGAIPERAEIRRAVQSPGRLLTLANPEIAGVVDSLMSEEADLDGDDQATAGCSSPEAETSCPL